MRSMAEESSFGVLLFEGTRSSSRLNLVSLTVSEVGEPRKVEGDSVTWYR